MTVAEFTSDDKNVKCIYFDPDQSTMFTNIIPVLCLDEGIEVEMPPDVAIKDIDPKHVN